MFLELLRSAPRLSVSYQRLLDIGFFVAVPLVLSLTMAVVGRYVDALGLVGGFLYVAALSFVPWWLAGIATQLVHRLLRPRPPLWVVASIGVLASVPLAALYSNLVTAWFQAHFPGGHLLADPSWAHWVDRIRDVALSAGRAVVLWTSFALIFASTLGWSRYTVAPLPPAGSATFQGVARLENSGNAWTSEDDAQLANLMADGAPPRAIAARLRRTVGAVRSRMRKLGLRTPS
jgi:hypothetical protein